MKTNQFKKKALKQQKKKIRYMSLYGAIIGILIGFLLYLALSSFFIFASNPIGVVRPEDYFNISISNLVYKYQNPVIIVLFLGSMVIGIAIGFLYIPI